MRADIEGANLVRAVGGTCMSTDQERSQASERLVGLPLGGLCHGAATSPPPASSYAASLSSALFGPRSWLEHLAGVGRLLDAVPQQLREVPLIPVPAPQHPVPRSLTDTAPVHVRGVADLFVAKLDDQDLAVLESALAKVTVNCGFG